jgi:hypothetical protein
MVTVHNVIVLIIFNLIVSRIFHFQFYVYPYGLFKL